MKMSRSLASCGRPRLTGRSRSCAALSASAMPASTSDAPGSAACRSRRPSVCVASGPSMPGSSGGWPRPIWTGSRSKASCGQRRPHRSGASQCAEWVSEHPLSERQVCRLVGLCRDRCRHPPNASTARPTGPFAGARRASAQSTSGCRCRSIPINPRQPWRKLEPGLPLWLGIQAGLRSSWHFSFGWVEVTLSI
jgi:hypothetical protein